MRPFSGAPLFVQAVALVVATAIAAQLVTLAVVVAMPERVEPFSFGDVAAAIRSRAPVESKGQTLSVETVDTAPEGWEDDNQFERSARATLANLLDAPLSHVMVEPHVAIPGSHWVMRFLSPPVTGPAPPAKPLAAGARATFEDFAAAARLPDGNWIVVREASPGLGLFRFLLTWLAANALVLGPLAWLFTRRLVEPIQAFAETAARAGRGDRHATFSASGPQEVRKAAHALSEMQRRIETAMEERTKLIAAVAHDLRTPLTRLRFRAESVPSELRMRIVRDIERMDAMIGGVLAFARGEQRVARERLEFVALVQSVVDDVVETGADVAITEAVPIEVFGDSLALRRLVGNILDNAVKYGGGARCRVLPDGADALLMVEDEGPGLAESSLERVFTPFERGDAARDPATGGVGLGLAIARAIARAHGGDVCLRRRSGHGLCAEIRLPAASAQSVESTA